MLDIPGNSGGEFREKHCGKAQDFVVWGKRWGTNETEAQVILQNQWDNILHHLMGITAATEVWSEHEPSPLSSSSCVGENVEDEDDVPTQQINMEETNGTNEGTSTTRQREPKSPKTQNDEDQTE